MLQVCLMNHNLYISNSKFKFITNIIVIFILIFIGDRLIAIKINSLYIKYRPAQAANVLNAIDYKSDILILGSSRAAHHYISSFIEEKMNARTYNLGQDGSNSLIYFCKLKLFVNAYKPKLIIYDISAITFENKPISPIYPLYTYNEVRKIINKQSPFNSIVFFLVKSYKYNSIYLSLLKKMKYPGDPLHGYVPLYGKFNKSIIFNPIVNTIPIEDKSKIDYFKNILYLCRENNIQLILINSPRLNYGPLELPSEIKKYITFDINYIDMNYIDYPQFKNIKLFKDKSHLNNDGSMLFSKLIISVIDNIQNKPLY